MTIKKLFQTAFAKKASDIHLKVGLPPVLRVHGDLKYILGEDEITKDHIEEMIFPVLTSEQKKTFLEKKGLDFGYEMDGFRLRINLLVKKVILEWWLE